jgi:hypothetical protein
MENEKIEEAPKPQSQLAIKVRQGGAECPLATTLLPYAAHTASLALVDRVIFHFPLRAITPIRRRQTV